MNSININIKQLETLKWQTANDKSNFGATAKTGDFNGDGFSDILVSIANDYDQDTSDIQIFLGNSVNTMTNGTYLLGARVPTYQTSNSMVADINKDGITDIVLAVSDGDGDTKDAVYASKQIIYLSKPDGGFETIQSENSIYAHHGVIADINGDGYLDAFFTATGIGPSLMALYKPDSNKIEFTSVGLPDRLLAATTFESWELIASVKNGFQNGRQTDDTFAVFHNHNTDFIDVDRDGDLDLVLFLVARPTRVYFNQSGKGDGPVFSNTDYVDVSMELSFLYQLDNTIQLIGDGIGNYLESSYAGFNPYDTIKFDANNDGWTDLIVVGTSVHNEFINRNGVKAYLNNSNMDNSGTIYEIFISGELGLINETEARISQIGIAEDYIPDGMHDGLAMELVVVDFNGDGHLDFVSTGGGTITAPNTPSWNGETSTAFMLNDGDGHFSRVAIDGLETGSFSPVPVSGKVGFIHVRQSGNAHFSAKDGSTEATLFKTDVPWTLGDSDNNYLYSTSADDSIDGYVGIDTFYANGRSSNFNYVVLAKGTVSITDLSGIGGVDALSNVERIRFDDKTVALDIDGHAGMTAKLLGATFGKASIANKDLVGIGLHMLDGGMSYSDLMGAVINAVLGSTASNAAVVELLYTNVIGSAPSVNDLAFFTDWLDKGIYTKASFGVLAADTELNIVNVGLVGLASTGLEYTPYVA